MRWNFVHMPELQTAGVHFECETALDVQVISDLMSAKGCLFSKVTRYKTGNFFFFHCPLDDCSEKEEYERWKVSVHQLYVNTRAKAKYWREKSNGKK